MEKRVDPDRTEQGAIALSLFEGDAFRRLLSRCRLETPATPRTLLRLVVFVGLTWPTMALLAALGGVGIGPSPRESFFLDVAAIAQFLIVLPLLLAAEGFIDAEVRQAGRYVEDSGLVPPSELSRFQRLLADVSRTRRGLLPELICLGAAYASTWVWLSEELGNGVPTWHASLTAVGERLTMAGWWDGVVAVPLFNFLLYRWVWKVVLWCVVLGRLSRLRLQLTPTHPDAAGGLAFLAKLQARFGVLIFAVGVMIAALVYQKIVIEGASRASIATWAPVVAFVILAPMAFAAPLLFFTGAMWRAKQAALQDYSLQLARICRSLDEKWRGTAPTLEARLGVGEDFDNLANISGAFANVKSMRVAPLDFGSLLRLAASSVVPMIPVILRFLPLPSGLRELLELLT